MITSIQEVCPIQERNFYIHEILGLRVAKEDRHLNLTRGRLSKALARQAAEKVRNEYVSFTLNLFIL